MQTETKFVFNTDYLGQNSLNYLAAWELQKQLHARVVQGADPQILLLEHPAVYTCGRRTEPHERPLNPKGAEVIEVDRGGKITFHGPGQLVGYPIIKLPAQIGVVDYVRRLEEALIAVCKELGLAAIQVPCRSGVWLPATPTKPERKLAAIGIRVSRGVTMHGFALNCNVDLERFNSFVPCGISDAGVSSLSAELGTEITTQAVLEILCQQLTKVLDFESSMITKDLS